MDRYRWKVHVLKIYSKGNNGVIGGDHLWDRGRDQPRGLSGNPKVSSA